jgi:hypothetical protein
MYRFDCCLSSWDGRNQHCLSLFCGNDINTLQFLKSFWKFKSNPFHRTGAHISVAGNQALSGISIFALIMKGPRKQSVNTSSVDLIVYHAIEEKTRLEHEMHRRITPDESLILTLDLMDFMSVLHPRDIQTHDDTIPWIILERTSK